MGREMIDLTDGALWNKARLLEQLRLAGQDPRDEKYVYDHFRSIRDAAHDAALGAAVNVCKTAVINGAARDSGTGKIADLITVTEKIRSLKLKPVGEKKYAWFAIYEKYDDVLAQYAKWIM